MLRFGYTIITKASPELAWKVFSDFRGWNNFANVYGEIRWREGKPWEAGSRLQIELLRPVHAVVDHVITSCVPGKRVGWIDHALGVALGQWVVFEPFQEGTRVHTWGDVVHSGVTIGGRKVEELINAFTAQWYESYRATCDRLAEAAIGATTLPDRPPSGCACDLDS